MRFRNQRGDTIVEVMIAAAIVGLVLVGGYSTANLNTQALRASQERAEALKVAQGQVELLRAFVAVTPGDTYLNAATTVNAFCLSIVANRPAATVITPLSTDVPVRATPTASYPSPQCQQSPAAGIRYATSIERNGSAPNFSFSVYVRWDGFRDKQEVRYDYVP